MGHWDTNSRPLGLESPPITTGPGLLSLQFLIFVRKVFTASLFGFTLFIQWRQTDCLGIELQQNCCFNKTFKNIHFVHLSCKFKINENKNFKKCFSSAAASAVVVVAMLCVVLPGVAGLLFFCSKMRGRVREREREREAMSDFCHSSCDLQ